jgi:anti-sigma factor RsiW
MTEMLITEDQLHAYVDGALDDTGRKAVERYLQQNPAAAEQVRAWQAINVGLQKLGNSLSNRPTRALDWKRGADELSVRRTSRATVRWVRIVAVAASIAVGVLGGWFGHEWAEYNEPKVAAEVPAFVQQATVAYELFASPAQGRPVELGAEQRDLLQRWLSGKAGLNVAMQVPKLDGLGWNLIGGRMLSDTRGPAALYVYENAQKNRMSLYVVALPEDVKKGGTWTRSNAVEICDWGKGRLHMALAGQIERDEMKRLLGPINQQILAANSANSRPVALPRLPDPIVVASLNLHR